MHATPGRLLLTGIREPYQCSFMSIQAELNEQILEITFQMNAKNTVNAATGKLLRSILDEHRDNSRMRGVLFKGSNGFFSNGFDPDCFVGATKADIEAVIGAAFHICGVLLNYPVPIAMVINGHAMGFGSILTLYGDYRYMQSKQARFGFPEIQIGLPIPSAPAMMLQDLAGRIVARDMILGKAFKADQALEAGIIDGVFDDEESMLKQARKDLSRLFGFPRSTVRMNREMMYARYKEPIARAIEHDIELASVAILAAAGQEGLDALKAGRRPNYDGID